MLCPYCKKVNDDNVEYCDKCGQQIKESSIILNKVDDYWTDSLNKQAYQLAMLRDEKDNIITEESNKKRGLILGLSGAVLLVGGVYYYFAILPGERYDDAKAYMEKSQYREALELYKKLDDYKDSQKLLVQCQGFVNEEDYNKGIKYFDNKEYKEAYNIFDKLRDYKESRIYRSKCLNLLVESLGYTHYWKLSESLNDKGNAHVNVSGYPQIRDVYKNIRSTYFNGNGDYLDCGTDVNLKDNFTINILFKCQNIHEEFSSILSKFADDKGPYYIYISKGRLNYRFTDKNGISNNFKSKLTLENNKWYNLSIVKIDGTMKVYINGSVDVTEKVGVIREDKTRTYIGTSAFKDKVKKSFDFKGDIAEIFILDRNLTEEELALVYQKNLEVLQVSNKIFHQEIPGNALSWNSHYYAIFDNCNSYHEAARYCASRGGYLATINSASENKLLYSYIKEYGYKNAFFGLNDNSNEGKWEWINREKLSYTNWHNGEPNGKKLENHAMFYYKFNDGTWNDGNFSEQTLKDEKVFICEWDLGSKVIINSHEKVKRLTKESQVEVVSQPVVQRSSNASVNNTVSKHVRRNVESDKYRLLGYTGADRYLNDNYRVAIKENVEIKYYDDDFNLLGTTTLRGLSLDDRVERIKNTRNVGYKGTGILTRKVTFRGRNTKGRVTLPPGTPVELREKRMKGYEAVVRVGIETFEHRIFEKEFRPVKPHYWYKVDIPGVRRGGSCWIEGKYVEAVDRK